MAVTIAMVVCSGRSQVTSPRLGYYYEGEFFQDDWYFNQSKDGHLTITYTDDSGDSGDGYIGSIQVAVINADESDRI